MAQQQHPMPSSSAAVSDDVDDVNDIFWRQRANTWLLVVGVASSVGPLLSLLIWTAFDVAELQIDDVVSVSSVTQWLVLILDVAACVALAKLAIVDEQREGQGTRDLRRATLVAHIVALSAQLLLRLSSSYGFGVVFVVGLIDVAATFALALWVTKVLGHVGVRSWVVAAVAVNGLLLFAAMSVHAFRPVGSAVVGVWLLLEVLRVRRVLS